MIANFFQKSKPINFLALSVLLLLVYLMALLIGFEGNFTLKEFFKKVLFFGTILLVFFIVNFIIRKNNLTEDNSYALLFFILCLGMFSSIFLTERIVAANFILMFAFRRIYSLRSAKKITEKIFDCAFWIGIACLIYPLSGLYLLLLYASVLIFRAENWRNLVIPIIGFICPIFICYAYYLFIEQTDAFLELISFRIDLHLGVYLKSSYLLPISLIAVFIFVAIILSTRKSISGKKDFKNTWYVLLFHVLISIVLIIMSPQKNGSEFLFLIFPISILFANYLQIIQRYWIKETVLVLFIVTLITTIIL